MKPNERVRPLINPNIEILKECQSLMLKLSEQNAMIVKMIAEPRLVIEKFVPNKDD